MKTKTQHTPKPDYLKSPTEKMKNAAKRAAKDAYLNDRYGHGNYDWQDAEVAAAETLEKLGLAHESAYEEGREIGAEVVKQIEIEAEDSEGR